MLSSTHIVIAHHRAHKAWLHIHAYIAMVESHHNWLWADEASSSSTICGLLQLKYNIRASWLVFTLAVGDSFLSSTKVVDSIWRAKHTNSCLEKWTLAHILYVLKPSIPNLLCFLASAYTEFVYWHLSTSASCICINSTTLPLSSVGTLVYL